MSVDELFDLMESEHRSAVPWPWPRTMTDDELAFWCSAWPDLKPTKGVFIGYEARVEAVYPGTIRYFTATIDLNSLSVEG